MCLPLMAAAHLSPPGKGQAYIDGAPTSDWQLLLQMGDFERAVEDCDSVLGMKQDTKALLRRGMALAALDELPRAKDDFVNVLSMEPNNRCGIGVHAILCSKVASDPHPLRGPTLQSWTGRNASQSVMAAPCACCSGGSKALFAPSQLPGRSSVQRCRRELDIALSKSLCLILCGLMDSSCMLPIICSSSVLASVGPSQFQWAVSNIIIKQAGPVVLCDSMLTWAVVGQASQG